MTCSALPGFSSCGNRVLSVWRMTMALGQNHINVLGLAGNTSSQERK